MFYCLTTLKLPSNCMDLFLPNLYNSCDLILSDLRLLSIVAPKIILSLGNKTFSFESLPWCKNESLRWKRSFRTFKFQKLCSSKLSSGTILCQQSLVVIRIKSLHSKVSFSKVIHVKFVFDSGEFIKLLSEKLKIIGCINHLFTY